MQHALTDPVSRMAFLTAVQERIAQTQAVQHTYEVLHGGDAQIPSGVLPVSRGWFDTVWHSLQVCGVALGYDRYARDAIAATIGVPPQLAHAVNEVFEGLPAPEAPTFLAESITAICAAHERGADLSRVWPQLALALVLDPAHGLLRLVADPARDLPEDGQDLKRVTITGGPARLILVAELYQRLLDGGQVTAWEWRRTAAGAPWFAKHIPYACIYSPSSAGSAVSDVTAAAFRASKKVARPTIQEAISRVREAISQWQRDTLLRLIAETTPAPTPLLLVAIDDGGADDRAGREALVQRLSHGGTQEIDRPALFNPDEISSASELRVLLLRLGFEEVTISKPNYVHVDEEINFIRRFELCHIQLRGQSVLISVLDTNAFHIDYSHPWPDDLYWGWRDDGILQGPCTIQALIARIHQAIQKAVDGATQP